MHMQIRGRGLKFASMAVAVVLALTGFSTGRGHGGTSSSSSGGGDGGGGGGGCSSSSQDHDTSSSYDNDDGSDDIGSDDDYVDDDYGVLDPAGVRLVKCATVKEPYATVEVTNPNPRDAAFWVDVSFKDRNGATIKEETWKIDVPADDQVTVDIEMARKSMASSVDHCVAEPEAEPIG